MIKSEEDAGRRERGDGGAESGVHEVLWCTSTTAHGTVVFPSDKERLGVLVLYKMGTGAMRTVALSSAMCFGHQASEDAPAKLCVTVIATETCGYHKHVAE